MRIIEGFADAAEEAPEGGGRQVPPHEILEPAERTAPFVFDSPHSGAFYPRAFVEGSRLDRTSLRRSEDCFVDELFAGVTATGAPLLKANFPRAFLDVNREPYELDPAMFDGPLPSDARTGTARVAAGLGTIARVVADNREIYPGPIPVAEALGRIDRLYHPYHAALSSLLVETRRRFGLCVLVDCHSMPSGARGLDPSGRPDIIVGDRFGTSCAGDITRLVTGILGDLGYRTGLNRPYAGGFITERYGTPRAGIHVVQVEINRGLYMDEQRFRKTASFEAVRRDMTAFSERLVAAVARRAGPLSDAAE